MNSAGEMIRTFEHQDAADGLPICLVRDDVTYRR